MKKAAKILGALLIVLASVSLFHEFHGVGDSVTGGTLLWNSQEAYLFVGWGRAGYHFTGFEYVWSHIPAYFGVPRTVDDNCLSTIVVRIAPDGIQRVVAEPYKDFPGFLAYIPNDGEIYAYDKGPLWKWTGARFEQASSEEQRKLALDEQMIATYESDGTNANGWSWRHFSAGWPSVFQINLQGKPVTLRTTPRDSGRDLTVKIELPGKAPETILRVQHDFHLVTKSEYERMFPDGRCSTRNR